MRVAIAEDGGLTRDALVALLTAAGVDVILSVSSGEELLALVVNNQPDVVITDLRMPPTRTNEGVVTARLVKARYPETGVLILSQYNDTTRAAQLIEDDLDGVGYLLKDNVTNGAALLDALGRVREVSLVVDPEVAKRLVDAHRRAAEISTLTHVEKKVLTLMAEGYKDKEISPILRLSHRTVGQHVSTIFRKFELSPGPGNKRVKAVVKWLRADGE